MIYLVRHGEAEAGWGTSPDPGLSALGLKQAEAVAEQLASQPVNQILASPMRRCQETSRPFAGQSGLQVSTEPAVTEIPTPDGLDDRVDWLRGFMAGTWDAAPPVVADWREALVGKLASIENHTVVFTHFIAINTIVGHLSGSDAVTSFRPGHCSVTKLQRENDVLRIVERGSEAATRVL
ncbi:MAG: histidine phosphatase family protein [Henriciella sp.]|jgi:broad specificity phosphatase PhoE|uniref:histidine phosphatase family protein n=1 Tax=Henriciella sp. TaxID=1968823 RepID=UPI000C0DE555|nr:histidine phosphatase family protein [Henriciella sp.]MAN75554.1 histidine phosphatase family protein [Henriciella sp.]MBF34029.1 histidine phosphatase family protein [Hyphomonadaceae bacterium]MBK73905.1 histidine phosphatase family protein [Henriciella sp.]PHR70973.1 MAG: histidine phosphatase family protein [Henriciella sp.]|tara:strand:+ start:163 stop:702 length:540 start_codon:yes stop_codon:yes gene_type:complete